MQFLHRLPWAVRVLAVAMAAVMFGTLAAAPAQAAPTVISTPHVVQQAPVKTIQPAKECARSGLGAQDFTRVKNAPATIGVSKVNATATLPGYCRVTGIVWPQVKFELRLPLSDWNGKYVQTGCGGSCGVIQIDNAICTSSLQQNYAVGAQNMGHESGGGSDDIWAWNNRQAEKDWAYRSTHVTAIIAKEILKRYYGVRPTLSALVGCSTGGREGVTEALHYPHDFQVIVAGAPAFTVRLRAFANAWYAKTMLDANGSPIVSQTKMVNVHNAVLKQCDTFGDGLVDGVIGEPRYCKFNLHALLCKDGNADTCLLPNELQAVQGYYEGPRDKKGRALYPYMAPVGAEDMFNGGAIAGLGLANNGLRYTLFRRDPGPNYSLADWNFDPNKVKRTAEWMDPVAPYEHPDLRKFRDAGGKFLLWQGLGDSGANPGGTYDLFAEMVASLGGSAKANKTVRYFRLPGVGHCGGGAGTDVVDFLTPAVKWYETGKAPSMIVGRNIRPGTARTRPLYPYPYEAHYKGTGDSNNVANWKPVLPAKLFHDDLKWVWDNDKAVPPVLPFPL